MAEPAALSIESVTVWRGAVRAVDGLSLEVQRGEVVALLGRNGSGKSTTLRAAAGTLDPASGTVRVDGVVRRDRPADYARRVGVVPQDVALYPELSARDNLRFFGSLYGLAGTRLRRRADDCLSLVGLAGDGGRPVAQLSGGMQRRVHLACALLHGPTLLLLDEPSVALDPPSRADLLANLSALRDRGHAVVLTTHLLEEAAGWSDRVALLEAGRLVACGSPEQFAGSGHVLEGRLRKPLDGMTERVVRSRLGPTVTMELDGYSLTLRADGGEALGRAVAALYETGAVLEAFCTPAPSLDALFERGRDF